MRFILLIFVSFSLNASGFKNIECGEYNEAEQLQLNPNKLYLDGRTKISYVDTGVDIFLNQFVPEYAASQNTTNINPEEIRKRPDFNNRRSKYYQIANLKDKYLFVESLPDLEKNRFHLKHTEIYPDIIFNVESGVLAGSRRGEFGGELVYFSQAGAFKVLAKINVEDIYELSFGIVIVSGLSHMSSNTGEIHVFNNDGSFTKLYNLLGAPIQSWLLNNGDLFIDSGNFGSQVLTSSGQLQSVECIDNKSLNTEAS